MGNIILLYEPKSDDATFSWGNWTPELPLENLANTNLKRVARSIGIAPEATRMRVALTQSETFRVIVLGPINADLAYLARIRAYTTDAFDVLAYDSDWFAPFDGAGGGSLGLEWEDPDFWLGNKPFEDAERGAWLIHIMPAEVTAQFWSIEIDNPGNPIGHIEAGRLFMGTAWQPSLNYTFSGNGLRFRNNTRSLTTLSGGKRKRRRINPRQFVFAFDYLPEAEGYEHAYRLMQVAGFDGECFVIPDPDDIAHMQRRSFLGQIEEMDALTQAAYGCVGTGMQIEEII